MKLSHATIPVSAKCFTPTKRQWCGGVAVRVCVGGEGGGGCNDGNVGFLRGVNKLYLWQTPKQQEFEEKKTNTFYFCSL